MQERQVAHQQRHRTLGPPRSRAKRAGQRSVDAVCTAIGDNSDVFGGRETVEVTHGHTAGDVQHTTHG